MTLSNIWTRKPNKTVDIYTDINDLKIGDLKKNDPVAGVRALLPEVGLQVLGTGHAVPGEPVPNARLAELVDTSDEWIVSRTGIRERYFCKDENNLDIAREAAVLALQRAGVKPEEIGVCLVATFTPDHMSPSIACQLQYELGMQEDTIVFDINAACAGFLYALQTAHKLLLAAPRRYALVLGSEVISRALDFDDRSTCVLFGDGAAAVVVELSADHKYYSICGSRGDTGKLLYCSGPADERLGIKPYTVHMNGPEVFRFAVDIIPRSINAVLDKAGLELDDIDHVVCHQANNRIIAHVIKYMKARPEQFFVNLQHYGNTSSASIPIALDNMAQQGLLKPGMKIVCVGFGAGFTWGACLLEW